MPKVVQFMRYRMPGVFSLERMFEDARAEMEKDGWDIEVYEAEHQSIGLVNRVKDIFLARKHQGDVNHQTGDTHYLTYLLDKRKTVLTIQDFIPLERFTGIKRFIMYVLWFWLPEKRASKITVTSHSTLRQLEKHLNCPPGKVRVIPIPFSPEFQHKPKEFNAEKPRILQVGAWEHKNVQRVTQALEGISCTYVIIGKLSDVQKSLLAKHKVEYENYENLSREDLLEQYALCDMLTFCSTYEGFGMPIIEGQATGRPVVTSNIWSMPEVGGDAVSLVDPYDVDSIRAGILKVIEDKAFRDDIIAKGFPNKERYSVQEVARLYGELYSDILAENNK